MTVCIAVACNQGREVITATDGKLSYGEISSDVKLSKMAWFKDWVFLYSGEPSNTDLIFEEVRVEAIKDIACLSRENIQKTVRRAYKRRFGKWSADRILSPYNMEMQEFKREGRAIFGDQKFMEMCREIETDAINFQEELLLIGWGKTSRAVVILEANRLGIRSLALIGLATLGSGAQVAMSTLLLLGCGRNMPFEDALYAVAASKFAAEKCVGVGTDTTIYITRKRDEKDDSSKPPGRFIQENDIQTLRELWERHSKPKIPNDAILKLHEIARRAGSGGGAEIMERFLRLASEDLVLQE